MTTIPRGLLNVKLIEPPCTERYARWCERSANQLMISLLLDLRVKVPNPPGSGKDIAEGKGVHREVESEGSRMWEQTNHGQISGLTNRNLI